MKNTGSVPPELPFDSSQHVPDQAPPLEVGQAGRAIDSDRGRVFPCENCGADMEFHIGQQSLTCAFCNHVQQINLDPAAAVQEQDYTAMLAHIRELRQVSEDQQAGANEARGHSEQTHQEIRCESCGGNVEFYGTLTSSSCPYCGVPIQLENAHRNEPNRISVDGLIPFRIEKQIAQRNLGLWIRSRWFAPNSFLKDGVSGKFNGVYLAYFTYDSMTFTAWSGQRGNTYTVTVGSGQNRRTETRTHWTPVSGKFQRFFDDIPILANSGMNREFIEALEPWPFRDVVPFDQRFLAGMMARTYDIELDDGFAKAKSRIDGMIENEVRSRIGGDRQSISSIKSQMSALTYRHLLLPVWLMAYRFHGRTYQIFINAATGEVQGERPYSAWKIAFASLLGLILAVLIFVWMSDGKSTISN